ncbi:hypothetical protein PR048_023099 [Dryococelus australis]|uniref:Uncharacterized protein n=1 Tax=Dryococelus australis TaxID=614101 RepID=A0ABQ9GT87_9NEOP|nr:hypothetical protein PR048_023099 [Dryococelus australis]
MITAQNKPCKAGPSDISEENRPCIVGDEPTYSGEKAFENVDSRFDRLGHLVISQEKQTRCRVCQNKVSTKCQKCDAALIV